MKLISSSIDCARLCVSHFQLTVLNHLLKFHRGSIVFHCHHYLHYFLFFQRLSYFYFINHFQKKKKKMFKINISFLIKIYFLIYSLSLSLFFFQTILLNIVYSLYEVTIANII